MKRIVMTDIMKKYAFYGHISYFEQKRIRGAKKRALTYILRQNKKDSIGVSLAVQFYYFMQMIFKNMTIGRSIRLMNTAGAALIVIIGLSVFYTTGLYKNNSGNRPPSLQAKILNVHGAVSVLTTDGSAVNAVAGTMLNSGDAITTVKNAFIDIETVPGIITRIGSGTKAVIGTDGHNNFDAIQLHEGVIFSTGEHGAAGTSYQISAQYCIVMPVGTLFSIKCMDNKTVIAVAEGRVLAKPKDMISGEDTILEAGNRVVITDGVFVDTITGPENDELVEFRNLYSGGIDMDKSRERTSGKEKISRLINQKTRTLTQIRGVYDRIDVVTLFSGRVLKGVIITSGSRYSVLTTDGVVEAEESEVKSVEVLK